MIYSFDTREEAGIPLEYRSISVNQVHPLYPSLSDWQGLNGLSLVVPKAEELMANVTFYDSICDTRDHVTYRKLGEQCVPFGCEKGYYRSGTLDSFSCAERVDPYIKRDDDDDDDDDNTDGLSTGMIVVIVVVSVVVAGLIVLLVLFLVKPSLFPCIAAKKAHDEAEKAEQSALTKDVENIE